MERPSPDIGVLWTVGNDRSLRVCRVPLAKVESCDRVAFDDRRH